MKFCKAIILQLKKIIKKIFVIQNKSSMQTPVRWLFGVLVYHHLNVLAFQIKLLSLAPPPLDFFTAIAVSLQVNFRILLSS